MASTSLPAGHGGRAERVAGWWRTRREIAQLAQLYARSSDVEGARPWRCRVLGAVLSAGRVAAIAGALVLMGFAPFARPGGLVIAGLVLAAVVLASALFTSVTASLIVAEVLALAGVVAASSAGGLPTPARAVAGSLLLLLAGLAGASAAVGWYRQPPRLAEEASFTATRLAPRVVQREDFP